MKAAKLLVLVGTVASPVACVLAADWEWTRVSAVHPPPVLFPAMAYDNRRGETVLFGGLKGESNHVLRMSRETWTWDGNHWRLAANTGPSAR